MTDYDRKYRRWRKGRLDCLAWDYFAQATPEERRQQGLFQKVLKKHAGARFDGDCFVSEKAEIYTDRLVLGPKSFVCGGAIIRHNFEAGEDCCIGSYCHIAGKVKLGSFVMMGGGSCIFGFNHGMEPDSIMGKQPCHEEGVVIGNDCWIGANATIVDGVTLGDHCIVAAGAVVTRSFPDWSVIGGVPARLIKRRRPEGTPSFMGGSPEKKEPADPAPEPTDSADIPVEVAGEGSEEEPGGADENPGSSVSDRGDLSAEEATD
ncbi:acyltransferase [Oecophyllibacter saccharovorans]|uniref:acyltransferase n=1 Tax=Oecophyllibacter saccharovorans TaxID=2558360 RepID=UPI0011413F55|nr:acyltransferase [Oecophyllibacter saccharovorans]QDH15502.1 acyltransferase [Oecophyllibacter saccharovorans]